VRTLVFNFDITLILIILITLVTLLCCLFSMPPKMSQNFLSRLYSCSNELASLQMTVLFHGWALGHMQIERPGVNVGQLFQKPDPVPHDLEERSSSSVLLDFNSSKMLLWNPLVV
jgi:hypothetical protein